MNVICLDAEFADNEELLELSIFNIEGSEIYHSFYRPERIRSWRTDIHHISPEMVENERCFRECRKDVERILSESDAVTGFAVGNDLRVLSHYGVRLPEDVTVIDVKDMYWYLRGRQEEMSPFFVPSLLVCANALGLEFSKAEAHSASADTEATVRCFNHLLEKFKSQESVADKEAVGLFMKRIEEEKSAYLEKCAAGFVKVFKSGNQYKLKFGQKEESDRHNLLMEIEVADRYKAEYELRKLLKKKEVPDKHSVYNLTAKLLTEIGSYKNEYDAEESAWCKKIVRNLSRLSL